MPYLVLKSCVADGSRQNVGDTVELSADEAKALVAMGRVEYVEPSSKPDVADRSVGLETSKVAAPKKRTRGKSNAN